MSPPSSPSMPAPSVSRADPGPTTSRGRFVTYLRVSTDKQGADGLGIEAQRAACRRYLENERYDPDVAVLAEVLEVASGGKNERPRLTEALGLCRDNDATLLVARLDRLSRSYGLLETISQAKVHAIFADNPGVQVGTAIGDACLRILEVFAAMERDLNSERTKAALARKRSTGKPATRGEQMAAAVEQHNERIAADVVELCRDAGPLTEWAKRLNQAGYRTAHGRRYAIGTAHKLRHWLMDRGLI